MVTISLCMVVKNEEKILTNCLENIKSAVDEIIIVDTGSTDATKDIARKYTSQIYYFNWAEDFSVARNFSFSKATKDFILWLDADHILLKEDINKLLTLKESLLKTIDYVTFICNLSDTDNNYTNIAFRQERLINRHTPHKWVGFLHEYIEIIGTPLHSDITVTHTRPHINKEQNLAIYQNKIAEKISFSPRDNYYYGKELFYNNLYTNAITQLNHCLSLPILAEEKLDTMYTISDCLMANGKIEEARNMIFTALHLSPPSGESLFRLAATFQSQSRYIEAINWYNILLNMPLPKNPNGFFHHAMWTWQPHLNLCVCYYALGKAKKAKLHNSLAAKYAPNHPSVIYNNIFFSQLAK